MTAVRPLHLVEVAPPWRSGYTIRTEQLALAQAAEGMKPAVAARPTPFLEPAYKSVSGCVSRLRHNGISYYRRTERRLLVRWWILATQLLAARKVRGARRFGRRLALPSDPWAGFLEELLSHFHPTVVHAHTPAINFDGARRLARVLGTPTVYEVRGFWEMHLEQESSDARIRGMSVSDWREREIRAALDADAVITLGQAMREELVARGVPGEKIQIIGNGVDPAHFRPLAVRDVELESKLSLGTSFVLGYVTSVHRFEGLDLVLEALRRLQHSDHDVVFVLVGDGPDLPRIRRLASQWGLSNRVRFVGRVPHQQVRRFYSLFDAFVVARPGDDACQIVTPLKPLEAMAQGIPTIISRLPGLCELVEPGARGWAFKPGDPTELARVVIDLMGNRSRAREVADEARRWVLEERTWGQMAARSRAVYESLTVSREILSRDGVA